MILKLYFVNSTRRVEFVDDENEEGLYLRLVKFLERTFQLHLGFSIKYKDDEGDLCNITGDLAMREALRLYPKVLKLNIDAKLDDDDFGFVLVSELIEGWELLHGDDLDQADTVGPLSAHTIAPPAAQIIPPTVSSPRIVIVHATTPQTTSSSQPADRATTAALAPQTVQTPGPPSATALSSESPEAKAAAGDKKAPAPALLALPPDLDAILGYKAVPVDRILWQYGRYRVKISGDGDCAFASVAQQLAASGGGYFTVNDLRQIFCDEITTNFSQWKLYFPGSSMEEINKFRSKGHWDSDLGDAVIIVLCLMFQVDCTIYRHDQRVIHSWSSEAGKSPMLHLAHHCAHFDATRPINTLSPKPVLVC